MSLTVSRLAISSLLARRSTYWSKAAAWLERVFPTSPFFLLNSAFDCARKPRDCSSKPFKYAVGAGIPPPPPNPPPKPAPPPPPGPPRPPGGPFIGCEATRPGPPGPPGTPPMAISSVRKSGGAAFKRGWAVDRTRFTPFQSSPVCCVTDARYSIVTGFFSFVPARSLYCGRQEAWLTR